MSAADLFRDGFDVEFRLNGTYIVIGRIAYAVEGVESFCDPENAILNLRDRNDRFFPVKLGRLPLSAMTYCPHGYIGGLFYTRGPARNRYQGITSSSLWAIHPGGYVESGGVGNVWGKLQNLCDQPRTRRPGKQSEGVLTRDVMIDPGNSVFVRGHIIGKQVDDNLIRPFIELDPITMEFMDNAHLRVMVK